MLFFYLLILVMPLATHPLWTRWVGELTVVKYMGAACLLYAVIHLSVRRTLPSFFSTWQARFFLILYVMATVSRFAKSLSSAVELSPFVSYTSFLLLLFVTVSIVDSLSRLRGVLLAAIGSVAWGSLYVIREWQKYHNVYRGFRPGWVVGDSNYFAVSALLCLPLALFLVCERQPRWEKLFCLGSLLVTLGGMTVCASRGGFVGMVAAFIFVACRSRHRLRNLALGSVLLVPLSLLSAVSPLMRLLHPSHSDIESAENRTTVWKAGMRMIVAHPIVGVGLGNFKAVVRQYEDPGENRQFIAHNVYIEIAAELGLPALMVFLAILCSSYGVLERVRRRTARFGPPLLHHAAAGIQAGLVGYAVSAFFSSEQYQKLFWLMIFLSMCLPALVRGALHELTEAAGRWRPDERSQLQRSGDLPKIGDGIRA